MNPLDISISGKLVSFALVILTLLGLTLIIIFTRQYEANNLFRRYVTAKWIAKMTANNAVKPFQEYVNSGMGNVSNMFQVLDEVSDYYKMHDIFPVCTVNGSVSTYKVTNEYLEAFCRDVLNYCVTMPSSSYTTIRYFSSDGYRYSIKSMADESTFKALILRFPELLVYTNIASKDRTYGLWSRGYRGY